MTIKLIFLIGLKFFKRNKFWILGIIAFLVALIFIQLKFDLFPTNTLRIGLVGTYQTHDLPNEVTKLVSEGLVKISEDGRVKPNLVSGWEVNNDATNFKFKLRDNLKWVDGTAIRSDDLVFSIPNVEISYPDNKTIEFKLKESYSPLPSLLTRPVFKKGTLLGMGPYKITNVEKSVVFITKINLESVDPNAPKIVVRFYPSEKVALVGFDLGEVQVVLGVNKGIQKHVDYSRIVTILFQTTDPLLGNRSVRQALSYQIPKIEGEELADNPYPPKLWAYDPNSKKYLSNPDEANAAMGRAKTQLTAEMLKGEIVLTTTPNLEEVGEVVINAWKALGFDAKLRIESGIPQNFQALLITQSIPEDPDQYFLWHATQSKTNLSKYDSKRVDKDLEDGRKIIPEAERKEKYFDFQRTLLEDAPAVFLYFPKYNVVYLKKIEGLLDKVINHQT